MWVDRPSGPLFGVLSEPLHAQAQLCAVLLPGRDHIGPNRMFVEIARRWAARGVPTLRIDLSPHVPEYVDDTCAVLEMLRARGLPTRFVLLGVCAGAYCAMHAALRDEQIAAIIMINPRGLIWSEETQVRTRQLQAARSTRRLRKRLAHRATLRKVFGGEIAPRQFVEVSRSLAAATVRTSLDRSRGIAGSWRASESRPDPLEPLLDALRDRGQRGLLAFTGREPQREELAATGLFDRLDRWPNLQAADHRDSIRRDPTGSALYGCNGRSTSSWTQSWIESWAGVRASDLTSNDRTGDHCPHPAHLRAGLQRLRTRSADDIIDAALIDSVALVAFLFEIEKQFGIEMPLESLEMDELPRTIESIARLVG